jgi:hypothetical protein
MKKFNRRHRRGASEDLERLSREALNAAALNEAEIDEIAGASDLYERIQKRIVAKRTAQRVARADRWGAAWLDSSLLPELLGLRRQPRLVFAVAFVMLLLFVIVMPRWLRTTPDAPQKAVILAPPSLTQTSVIGAGRTDQIVDAKPDKQTGLSGRSKRAVRRRAQATGEIATDFIPLTWVTEATAMDSGQVVRVKVPRAMLLSIGAATNTAGAGEFLLADVVVSDDGLVRAIRLVNR